MIDDARGDLNMQVNESCGAVEMPSFCVASQIEALSLFPFILSSHVCFVQDQDAFYLGCSSWVLLRCVVAGHVGSPNCQSRI